MLSPQGQEASEIRYSYQANTKVPLTVDFLSDCALIGASLEPGPVESSANGINRATKVLIVDTDATTVHELGAALRGEGWEALEATSYEEARRLWLSERPSMLIADIRLGQFNGLQLLLRARAERPDVAGVITSAIPDKVLEADTRRFGGTFVVKPLARDQVISLLQSLRPTAASGRDAVSGGERRVAERRQLVISGFAPDRRLADRRKPLGA